MFVRLVVAALLAGQALAQAEPGPPSSDCVAFQWGRIAYGAFENDRASVLVPVRIEAQDRVVPFQLDTGSGRSYVYDTSIPEKETGRTLATGIGIDAPGWTLSQRTVRLKGEAAIVSSHGTLGVDLLGPGVELDLKGGRLCPLTPDRAAAFSRWEPMERSGSSPVIRVKDGKRELRLLLDTGSSAFSVLTTRGRSDAVKRGEKVRKINVPSFNSTITVTELVPEGAFTAFGRTLATPHVYAFDHMLAGVMLDRGGIDGLIGLTPFAGGSLAFDFAGWRVAFREE